MLDCLHVASPDQIKHTRFLDKTATLIVTNSKMRMKLLIQVLTFWGEKLTLGLHIYYKLHIPNKRTVGLHLKVPTRTTLPGTILSKWPLATSSSWRKAAKYVGLCTYVFYIYFVIVIYVMWTCDLLQLRIFTHFLIFSDQLPNIFPCKKIIIVSQKCAFFLRNQKQILPAALFKKY